MRQRHFINPKELIKPLPQVSTCALNVLAEIVLAMVTRKAVYSTSVRAFERLAVQANNHKRSTDEFLRFVFHEVPSSALLHRPFARDT
jgi:hypothetical protein